MITDSQRHQMSGSVILEVYLLLFLASNLLHFTQPKLYAFNMNVS